MRLLRDCAFPFIMLVGWFGLLIYQAWHHDSRAAILETLDHPWPLGYVFFLVFMVYRRALAGCIALALAVIAWFSLRLALTPMADRDAFVCGAAEVLSLGVLAWAGWRSYGAWNRMIDSRRKVIAGLVLALAFMALTAVVSMVLVGRMIGGWHPMSLSEWGIVAVIAYLPAMFLGWVIYQKLQAVKYDA